MAPYSMDLRERVARAWDASGDADDVAAKFGGSRAWVHRLVQRWRETGSLAPRKQTKFRSRALAGQERRLATLIRAQPDITLAELRDMLPTTAALSTLWLEIDRLGLTLKKNVHADEQRRPDVAATRRRCRSTMRELMAAALGLFVPDECATTSGTVDTASLQRNRKCSSRSSRECSIGGRSASTRTRSRHSRRSPWPSPDKDRHPCIGTALSSHCRAE